MSDSRRPYFQKCPKCDKQEVMFPARGERGRKDIQTWSMVIPQHSRQFLVSEIEAKEWWCSACDAIAAVEGDK